MSLKWKSSDSNENNIDPNISLAQVKKVTWKQFLTFWSVSMGPWFMQMLICWNLSKIACPVFTQCELRRRPNKFRLRHSVPSDHHEHLPHQTGLKTIWQRITLKKAWPATQVGYQIFLTEIKFFKKESISGWLPRLSHILPLLCLCLSRLALTLHISWLSAWQVTFHRNLQFLKKS